MADDSNSIMTPMSEEMMPDAPPTKQEPSAMESISMYLTAEVMGKSTSMSQMNAQMKQLEKEVEERHAAMNQLRSKMLGTQGFVTALHAVQAELRKLTVSDTPNTE